MSSFILQRYAKVSRITLEVILLGLSLAPCVFNMSIKTFLQLLKTFFNHTLFCLHSSEVSSGGEKYVQVLI